MREEKKFIVEELTNEIRGANPLVFTDYCRVKAKDLTQLRAHLKVLDSGYRVVQNTLFQRALNNVGLSKYGDKLTGPVAVAYGGRDVVSVIKALIKFVKDNPNMFIVKGGIVDNQYFELKGLEELSRLPPKEVLLARLVSQMNAPVSRFVFAMKGNLQKLIYVLSEISKKKMEPRINTNEH